MKQNKAPQTTSLNKGIDSTKVSNEPKPVQAKNEEYPDGHEKKPGLRITDKTGAQRGKK